MISDSDAAVYPSIEEGFGLPIGESLWLGAPCLYHDGSAMAETAPGGGTFAVDMLDERSMAEAISACATDPRLLGGLAKEARERRLASWDDYAAEVLSVIKRVSLN